MRERLLHYWTFIGASLWFLPLLMSIGSVAAAVVLLSNPGLLPDGLVKRWPFYGGDAESARQLLGAMLSGIITMTSLVVSITLVVLTLAAGQLGPRLVRNFIGDRQTQSVLGLFVATILYLLVVFRSMSGPAGDTLPHLAVTVGTFLSALCLFVLLFYVHKLARAIQYDNVVNDVMAELRDGIERLLPDHDSPLSSAVPEPEDAAWIGLGRDGYVETIDFGGLVRAACKAEAVLWVTVRPGHFVLGRGAHVAVHPPQACSDELAAAVRSAFIVGGERTPTQDLEYGIRQLVEIALRALSPGINDVYTALVVIDNLTAALAMIFERPLEAVARCDGDGKLRVVRTVADHDGLVRAAFDQIRQSGATMPAVLIRVAEGLVRLAPYATAESQRRALREQLDLVADAGERGIGQERDRAMLRDRCRAARARLRPPVITVGPEGAEITAVRRPA